jgi:hypothetical protein
MTLHTFTITLTPTERFFFGGEIVFGGDGADQRRRSYLVKSRCLPQQTSLLGLVREQTLAANNQLRRMAGFDLAKARTLVGNTGFHLPGKADGTGLPLPFGAIQTLSPLSLRRTKIKEDGKLEQSCWHPVALDVDTVEITSGGKKEEVSLSWQHLHGQYWNLEHFNAKTGLSLRFGAIGTDPIKLDDCFAEHTITGNRISNRNYRDEDGGEAKEEGLFCQTFRRNVTSPYAAALDGACQKEMELPKASEFGFQFQVTIDTDLLGAAAGALKRWKAKKTVSLGGEQSTFTWEVTHQAPDPFTPASNLSEDLAQDFRRIVLQSDTYLPQTIVDQHEAFLLGNPKSFRFFQSKLDQTKQFNDLESDPGKKGATEGRWQSAGYTLIERGGVLLVPEPSANALQAAIESYAHFRQIGYNHCTITQ